MYQYKAIDLSYFDTAPVALDDAIEIDCSAEEIWPIFENNADWEGFTSGIKKATWTSALPLHAGSTRNVELSGMLGATVVNEVFFNWEPQSQFAFYMKDGTSKKIEAYGEWWSLEVLGNGKTRLRLRTAFALKGKFSERLAKIIRPLLSWGYSQHLRSVKKYVGKHVTRN